MGIERGLSGNFQDLTLVLSYDVPPKTPLVKKKKEADSANEKMKMKYGDKQNLSNKKMSADHVSGKPHPICDNQMTP